MTDYDKGYELGRRHAQQNEAQLFSKPAAWPLGFWNGYLDGYAGKSSSADVAAANANLKVGTVGVASDGSPAVWDGSRWVSRAAWNAAHATAAQHATTTKTPRVGDTREGGVLRWDGSKWVRVSSKASTARVVESHTVGATRVVNGQNQRWNGTKWVNFVPHAATATGTSTTSTSQGWLLRADGHAYRGNTDLGLYVGNNQTVKPTNGGKLWSLYNLQYNGTISFVGSYGTVPGAPPPPNAANPAQYANASYYAPTPPPPPPPPAPPYYGAPAPAYYGAGVDPVTGQPIPQYGSSIPAAPYYPPAYGTPAYPTSYGTPYGIDPSTGLPLAPQGGYIDPNTGMPTSAVPLAGLSDPMAAYYGAAAGVEAVIAAEEQQMAQQQQQQQQYGYDQSGYGQQYGYDQSGYGQQYGYDQSGYGMGGYDMTGGGNMGYDMSGYGSDGSGYADIYG